MLKEEIGSEFDMEQLLHMLVFHGLNIVRGREKDITTFINKLLDELK